MRSFDMEVKENRMISKSGPGSSGRNPQRRTIEKRQRIESEAAHLFAGRGFDGVSMRDIGLAADVQLGTLTYLYPDKQAIYDQVVRATIAHFGDALLSAVAEPAPPREQLTRFIHALVKLYVTRSIEGQIVARELVDAEHSRIAIVGREMFVRLREVLNPIVASVTQRTLSGEEAGRLTGHLINMSYGAVRSAGLYIGTFDKAARSVEEQAQDVTDLILNGLLPRA
jgi:AcrR family transcriptional regulator